MDPCALNPLSFSGPAIFLQTCPSTLVKRSGDDPRSGLFAVMSCLRPVELSGAVLIKKKCARLCGPLSLRASESSCVRSLLCPIIAEIAWGGFVGAFGPSGL